MAFDLTKVAKNNGFDDAYLVPGMFVSKANDFGLLDLKEIMPEAQSVLLLIKKHNPYSAFPEGVMSVQSHYLEYHSAYLLHRRLIEKLNSIGVAAESANMISLKSYSAEAGLLRLKNTLGYHEEFGTYFVMQAIAVDVECEFSSYVKKNVCVGCDKCIRACPTGAINIDGTVNRERCIRNHVPVSGFVKENVRLAAKTDFIGCGVCQDVCPLNKDIKKVSPPKEVCDALTLSTLLDLENNRGAIRALQTLIGRNEARPSRTVATACLAAGNLKDDKHLAYLQTILSNYINPLARGYAAWAIGKIGGEKDILIKALVNEHNQQVKSEILSALTTN